MLAARIVRRPASGEACVVIGWAAGRDGRKLYGGTAIFADGELLASSSATCLPEVYGNAAHYFDPLDIDDMAREIDDIITNDDLRTSLIEKGYAQNKKYSWKRMAEQTHAIYMNALNN